ncbi:MAG: hypothetical protein M1118_05315 [Chloroflexi bacterium]|nr:hypothetical protein [Chloroflexota bacterium]
MTARDSHKDRVEEAVSVEDVELEELEGADLETDDAEEAGELVEGKSEDNGGITLVLSSDLRRRLIRRAERSGVAVEELAEDLLSVALRQSFFETLPDLLARVEKIERRVGELSGLISQRAQSDSGSSQRSFGDRGDDSRRSFSPRGDRPRFTPRFGEDRDRGFGPGRTERGGSYGGGFGRSDRGGRFDDRDGRSQGGDRRGYYGRGDR